MNASHALHTSSAPGRIAGFIRSIPAVHLSMILGAVVCASVALAAYQGEWLRAPAAHPSSRALSVQADGTPKAQARRRCENCGFVESIRRIAPEGDAPASYEFTVRLRDGTARTSSDPSGSRWRTGDRVMLIGGGGAIGK